MIPLDALRGRKEKDPTKDGCGEVLFGSPASLFVRAVDKRMRSLQGLQ